MLSEDLLRLQAAVVMLIMLLYRIPALLDNHGRGFNKFGVKCSALADTWGV